MFSFRNYEIMQYLSFCIMSSRFIHVVANGRISLFIEALWDVCVCVCAHACVTLKKNLCIYLAVLGLSFGTWNL